MRDQFLGHSSGSCQVGRVLRGATLLAAALFAAAGCAAPPPPPPAAPPPVPGEGAVLITVFLRHDQSMNLDQIGEHLKQTQFWANFPPPGIEIASWYVMMGIGHVVTLRVPPSRLREVNLAIEKRAWGAFRSEFYPTYDYREIFDQRRKEALGDAGQGAPTPAPTAPPSPAVPAP